MEDDRRKNFGFIEQVLKFNLLVISPKEQTSTSLTYCHSIATVGDPITNRGQLGETGKLAESKLQNVLFSFPSVLFLHCFSNTNYIRTIEKILTK